jgi:anion-transporting  ArsA/GET3 family ATPase
MGFMDEGVLKVFMAPTRLAGRMGFGFLAGSGAWMFKALERITGFEVLRDVSDFVGSFAGMHAGFRDRAKKVETFLRAPGSTFVLVTSPNPLTVDEATYFYGKLTEKHMPFGGFIVNRVHADALQEPGAREVWQAMREAPARILRTLGAAPDASLAEWLAGNFERMQELAEIDAAQMARLQAACAGAHFWRPAPAFDVDIHDLSGLARVNRQLFPGGG